MHGDYVDLEIIANNSSYEYILRGIINGYGD